MDLCTFCAAPVWFFAAVGCFYFVLGLLNAAKSSHNVPHANPSRAPPDQELFPQYIQNKQGLWLFWRQWNDLPKKYEHRPRGVVFLISGLGEHTGRYENIGRKLNNEGFVAFCMDHQGQGGSEGCRAYYERFNDIVEDYSLFIQKMLNAKPEYKDTPRFVVGHSMGGLVAVHVVMATNSWCRWSGAVLSAPALLPDPASASPLLIFVAKVLSRVLPKLAIKPIDHKDVCRTEQVVLLYGTDPLVYHGGIRARWGAEMLAAMDQAMNKAHAFNIPLLMVHGQEDKITAVDGSKQFFGKVTSSKKDLKLYEGMRHEVMNEPDRAKVYADIFAFLNKSC